MAAILIIEDEVTLRVSMTRMLARARHTVWEAGSMGAANQALRDHDPDLVLTDVDLGDGNGIDLVERLRSEGFGGVIVVITAFGTVANAVAAMKKGADDFLQKPVKMEELPLQVEKWLQQRRVTRRLELYKRLEKTREDERTIVGRSRAWQETLRLAERLATMPLVEAGEDEGAGLPVVLLMGETGSGKGVLARYIHQRACAGEDAESPFVHVNCTTLPATLVESELFGHEKGAFTDARDARAGLFEMADGGTIFLDEISEMPLELQAKLLVAVEQGRFRRVGGTKDRVVRVRVIAATNADLEKRVEEGRFRRDLLYRLNAFTVALPALRERNGDAVEIAEAALERFARRYGRPAPRLSDAARTVISSHAWPGNVRELVNTMQRVAMLCEGERVEAEDLRLRQAGREVGAPGGHGLPVFDFTDGAVTADALERELIVQALAHTQGNVTRAAKLIGVTRASMRYRMDQYGLTESHAGAES